MGGDGGGKSRLTLAWIIQAIVSRKLNCGEILKCLVPKCLEEHFLFIKINEGAPDCPFMATLVCSFADLECHNIKEVTKRLFTSMDLGCYISL